MQSIALSVAAVAAASLSPPHSRPLVRDSAPPIVVAGEGHSGDSWNGAGLSGRWHETRNEGEKKGTWSPSLPKGTSPKGGYSAGSIRGFWNNFHGQHSPERTRPLERTH